jgi:hypothetical protein
VDDHAILDTWLAPAIKAKGMLAQIIHRNDMQRLQLPGDKGHRFLDFLKIPLFASALLSHDAFDPLISRMR